jgi:putative oxidoreductase
MLAKMAKKHGDCLYALFSLLIGFMFFQHGTGKLLGWFGGSAVELVGLMGLAGVIETFAGLALLLGFFSRLGALLGSGVMIVGFVMFHLPNGWNPLANGGELALVYLAAFLVVLVNGNHKWSLEQKLLGKEQF